MEWNPELIDLVDVLGRQSISGHRIWRQRFDDLPLNKAGMLKYNNRQRAHQVRNSIRQAGVYWHIPISTRVMRGDSAIHGVDGWLVYFWKREVEDE